MLNDFAILFIPLVVALAICQLWNTSPKRRAHFAFGLLLFALPLPGIEALPGKWSAGWRLFLVGFTPAVILPPVLLSSFANLTFILGYVCLLRGSAVMFFISRFGAIAAVVAVVLGACSNVNILYGPLYHIDYEPGQIGLGAGLWMTAHIVHALAQERVTKPKELTKSLRIGVGAAAIVGVTVGIELLILLQPPESVEWKRVNHVAFSPDGQSLATAVTHSRQKYELEVNHYLTIWDVATRKKTIEFPIEEGITCLGFSPSGAEIAFGAVKYHDVAIDRPKFKDELTGNTIVTLSQANRIPGRAGEVHLWNSAKRKVDCTLTSHNDKVNSLSFAPDGCTIATASDDRTIILWSLPSGTLLTTLQSSEAVLTVTYSPDGRSLATTTNDGAISVWDTLLRQEAFVREPNTSSVKSVAFSPDGKNVAAGDADGRVVLLDVASGNRRILSRGFNTHSGAINELEFSPDGKKLATVSSDFTARLWEVASGRVVHTLIGHTGGVNAVRFLAEGTVLATAGNSQAGRGEIRLWSIESGEPLGVMQAHGFDVLSMDVAPDKRTLVTTGFHNGIKFWDSVAQTLDSTWPEDGWCLTFSPDGKSLCLIDFDYRIRMFDVAKAREIRGFEGQSSRAWTVAFSPDGMLLASGNGDGTIKLWDASTRTEVAVMHGHEDGVHSITFSHDSTVLVSGSNDQTVRLWDVQSAAPKSVLQRHVDSPNSVGVAFSPTGTELTVVSWDGWIQSWDLRTRELIANVKGPMGRVASVSRSPVGDLLTYGSYDHAAVLWDMEQNQLRSILTHPVDVLSVSFSPDGRLLATGEGGTTSSEGAKAVRFWNTNTGREEYEFLP